MVSVPPNIDVMTDPINMPQADLFFHRIDFNRQQVRTMLVQYGRPIPNRRHSVQQFCLKHAAADVDIAMHGN